MPINTQDLIHVCLRKREVVREREQWGGRGNVWEIEKEGCERDRDGEMGERERGREGRQARDGWR